MENEIKSIKKEDIIHLVRILSKKIRASFDRKLAEFDLTSQQGRCLCYIASSSFCGKEIHQNDLEKHFELSKSTVSGLIDRIEKKGFIERKNDGHSTLLVPTDKGKEFIEDVSKGREQMIVKLFEGLNDEQIACFTNVAKYMISNMENLEEKEENLCGKE